MANGEQIKKLTVKLGAVCEGEEPAVVLASLVTVFACLTAPVDDEQFNKAVEFFNSSVGGVREDLLKADKEEKPQ
jgi:hypothetical protein